ncbi:HU family DNA-binding protein [Paraburkholderia bannensis]|uniref:HU family DNA-binding protein n=1 Tax=Paraburkholderia bannensis TaxID=765414 RepID=UPI002AB6207A|nr:HU family DNA-binding protein [Paraburkholderia bannensis]
MATKTATKAPKPAKSAAPKAAKPATRQASPKPVTPAKKAATNGVLKPLKEMFTKASLATHVAEQAGVEPKAAKAVLAALEDTILRSVHKKGAGEFTLSGLVKIGVQAVPAKKKRFGKDPFTGQERWFDAKPATVKLKIRALKKLKDAASA